MLQSKLDVLIQEREQESQKLLFGIGTAAITKSLFGSASKVDSLGGKEANTEAKAIISQRLKGREKEVNKLSNFDKILEKQNEKKMSKAKKLRMQGDSNINVASERMGSANASRM